MFYLEGFGYTHLSEGSYYGFLVAMAVCVLLFKCVIILVKILDFEEKIPYFDVFVSMQYLTVCTLKMYKLQCKLYIVCHTMEMCTVYIR